MIRSSGKEAGQAVPRAEVSGVPLVDMTRQYAALAPEIQRAINRVCESGQFVLGPDCKKLEERLAAYCQATEGIACASGSDALLLALMAVGVGVDDEVIVPSYTFFATAGAVSRLGARPVFVDIDPVSYCLDPRAVEPCITGRTRAIIPVHLYGQCADMDHLNAVARRHSIPVLEDSAQAIGAELNGRRTGCLGDVACFSFYPTKNLGGFGDGGFLSTCSPALAARLRMLRVHGEVSRYQHKVVGINSRLDSLQAAVLNVKLDHLDDWTVARARAAARYDELFRDARLDGYLGLPTALAGRRHVWNQYVIRCRDGRRDALRQYLIDRQVGTQIYYPIPLHRQECFHDLGYAEGSLPETERASKETLALPIFAELTLAEQAFVVRQIAEFYGRPAGGHSLKGPKFLHRRPQLPDDAEEWQARRRGAA
jgi:dTDP-4-amino-4,6-dideoxygalactose transaminase